MIIVNTTFVLNPAVESEILSWVRHAYDQSALHAGALAPGMLTRVLSRPHGDDCVTYAMHITFPDTETARRWNEGVGESLRQLLSRRWGEHALTFHTYLEVIE